MRALPSHRHAARDGTSGSLTSGNVGRDGCDASPRGCHNRTNSTTKRPHLTDPPNASRSTARQASTTTPDRSCDHAPPTASNPNRSATEQTGSTGTTELADNDRVPRPRQSATAESGAHVAAGDTKRRPAERPANTAMANMAGHTPTPEQWAQEQLKHAPQRSRAWARKVATIYGLDLPHD